MDGFLEYDYVGAPWLVSDWSSRQFGLPAELIGKMVVGNGGFSLRSRRFLELCAELAASGEITAFHPEDTVLMVHHRELLERRGMRVAPVEVAARFSYEALDGARRRWDGQLGFHGLSWTDISAWTSRHPEYAIDNPAARK